MVPLTVSLCSALILPDAQLGHYINHHGVANVFFKGGEGEVVMSYVYEADSNSRDGVDNSGAHDVGGSESHDGLWRNARLSRLPYSSHEFLGGCPTGRYLWCVRGQGDDEGGNPPGHIYMTDYDGTS